MKQQTLTGRFDADRERILGLLNDNRDPEYARDVLEKALERIDLACAGEDAPEARERTHLALVSLRGALGLIAGVGDVRLWERAAAQETKRMPVRALAAGIAGVALVVVGAALPLAQGLLPALIGAALAALCGRKSFVAQQHTHADAAATKREFLIDPEKVVHEVRCALVLIDAELARMREADAAPVVPTDAPEVGADVLDLAVRIMEAIWMGEDPEDAEAREALRFFLHRRGVELVETPEARDPRFEFLPAQRPGVICPALVQNDRLIRKGLAAR